MFALFGCAVTLLVVTQPSWSLQLTMCLLQFVRRTNNQTCGCPSWRWRWRLPLGINGAKASVRVNGLVECNAAVLTLEIHDRSVDVNDQREWMDFEGRDPVPVG